MASIRRKTSRRLGLAPIAGRLMNTGARRPLAPSGSTMTPQISHRSGMPSPSRSGSGVGGPSMLVLNEEFGVPSSGHGALDTVGAGSAGLPLATVPPPVGG